MRTGLQRTAHFAGAAFTAALASLLLGGAALAEPVPLHPKKEAPAGVEVSVALEDAFDDAGTNPRFTAASFSTMAYYDDGFAAYGRVHARAMSAADLNALPSPPPSPFTVTVTVTMTNDGGELATGTVTFETSYDRQGLVPAPAPPSPPPTTSIPPVFLSKTLIVAPVGVAVSVSAGDTYFDDLGTNPRFTGAVFSTTDYYDESRIDDHGRLRVKAKSAKDLNALPSPPPGSFSVDVAVTIANDEGRTITGTLTFETRYARAEAVPAPPGSSPATLSQGGQS